MYGGGRGKEMPNFFAVTNPTIVRDVTAFSILTQFSQKISLHFHLQWIQRLHVHQGSNIAWNRTQTYSVYYTDSNTPSNLVACIMLTSFWHNSKASNARLSLRSSTCFKPICDTFTIMPLSEAASRGFTTAITQRYQTISYSADKCYCYF